MADYTPYAPGVNAARSIWDEGIAPLAEKVQGFLKGTAGLPGTVKDYGIETLQSDLPPAIQVGVDAFKLANSMREGIKEDPLRAIAEINPFVGGASDLFETNKLLNMAQNAEESGDSEKAQTLRELANTIMLMGIIPGAPPAKRTIAQKLKDMEEKRRKLTEETGLPYVPNKKPPPAEGRRIDVNDPELDRIDRQKKFEQDSLRLDSSLEARTARATDQGYNMDDPLYHYTDANFTEFELPNPPKDSVYGPGIYTSRSPDRYKPNAAYTANPDNIKQIPLVARGKLARPGDVSAAEAQIKRQIEEGTRPPMRDPGKSGNWRNEYWVDIHQVLKDQGFTGLQMGEITLIFEPKNLRSIDAEFNPAKAGSADLLSGIGSLEAAEGIA